MAISTVYTYDLNGSTKDFNIPFEYLARRFVKVTLIGVDRKVLSLSTDYRFTSKTSIQTTIAWGPSTNYERIEVRRETSATERLVDFADGSILRSYEMNLSQIQTLHVAEEARNMVADTISENQDGDLDARGRRLVNLADALEPDHAVTLRQEQSWASSTLNNKNASEAARDVAIGARDAALAYRDAAGVQAGNANTSAINAEVSNGLSTAAKVAAEAAKVAAEAARDAATTQAGLSATQANSASLSATASDTAKVAAEAAAAAAAGSAASVNMPSAIGNRGKFLAQKDNESGLEYVGVPGKNFLHNPCFRIWTREVYSASNKTGYMADRWLIASDSYVGSNIVTSGVAFEGDWIHRFTVNTKGSCSMLGMVQGIEHVQTIQGPATVSFKVRSSRAQGALTIGVRIDQQFGGGGSTAVQTQATNQVTKVPANTWATYSFTVNIPPVTGKTFGSNHSLNCILQFSNLANGETIDVQDVKMETGVYATPFVKPDIAEDQRNCMRYCQRLYLNDWNFSGTSLGSIHALYVDHMQMRVKPTITTNFAGGLTMASIADNTRLSVGAVVNGQIRILIWTKISGWTPPMECYVSFDGRFYIHLEAEF